MDAVTRVQDAVALTAYVQALVHHYSDAPSSWGPPVIAQENKWRAARYGLDALICDASARGPVPLRRVIERTLELIAPSVAELGSARELLGIERILRNGNGASRQLATFEATRDVHAVARDIAARTAT